MKRRRSIAILTAGVWVLCLNGSALAGGQSASYTFQTQSLAPLGQSRTFEVTGGITPTGCTFQATQVRLPAGVDRWEVRDLGIDLRRCMKLVEEGVPPVIDDASPDLATEKSALDSVSAAAGPTALATLVTHSGYASARFENIFGQTLAKDTTRITWGISGSCVTAGNASGEWTWNTVGYSLSFKGGGSDYSCSREHGYTWSTFQNNASNCSIVFSYVHAYGWNDGTISGSRTDSATCVPLWEHFDVVRTT